MAEKQTRRLTPKRLTLNENAFATLQAMADYNPANGNYSVGNGRDLAANQKNARDREAQLVADLKTARDNATAAEWAMHNYMLGVKDQVAAQFGKSSNQYQGLGLKKKTEYKRPVGKKTKNA